MLSKRSRTVLFWAAIVACFLVQSCSRKAPRGPGSVKIGVSSLRISLPLFVALERDLFRKRGLAVEIQRFDTAQPLADELAAGRIDAGGYVAFPILFASNNPPPHLRVVTAIVEDAKHPLSYLLVRKGSGLHGTASLEGRKIGILPTIAYRRWIEEVLRHDGVALPRTSILAIAPPLQVDALAGGEIDALFTGDPMATAALARGVAEPATDTPDVPRVLGEPFFFGTFAFTETFAQTRPDDARALRDALDEAIGLIEADQAAGRAAMAPYVRQAERAFIDRYPPARYLRSGEVRPEQLDRALELSGSTLKGSQVVLP